MSRHRPDLIMCLRQPGISQGLLCQRCEGKCPMCDSFVHPTTPVRVCDECSFPPVPTCIVCRTTGAATPAFYCRECTQLERDRDGCPQILNMGTNKVDYLYSKRQKAQLIANASLAKISED